MRRPSLRPALSSRPLAVSVFTLTALCAAIHAHAETPTITPSADELPAIGVSASIVKRSARAGIAGLGDLPAWQTPVQAQTFGADTMKDAGMARLSDLSKLDASTTDSYNTTGYWDYLTIRGFKLDNAYNYRREGLPVSAETRLLLDNKAAVELLKGTTGLQSGVSSPGGLVNLLVKRPTAAPQRSVEVGLDDAGAQRGALDVSTRFGADDAGGLRVNAAASRLNTHIDNTKGRAYLLAVATDWRLSADTLLEAELEHSLTSQPSVPGLSLLGNTLPSDKAYRRSLNLNHQAWTQPVELQGLSGSLRWRQNLGQGWDSSVMYGFQRLQMDDRAAFPYTCGLESLGDRFCSNGTTDLYDYRSEDERRHTQALKAELNGRVNWGGLQHQLRFSVLRSLYDTDIKNLAFNLSGNLPVRAPKTPLPAQPALTSPGTNRWERSTEWSAMDHIRFSDTWQAWAGVRHTQLSRSSVQTDGGEAIRLSQNVTTPWLALGWTVAPQTQAYLSWGQGIEMNAAPRNTGLDNPGQVLPALKSRQTELGIKGQHTAGRISGQWGANLFLISRPLAEEVNNRFQYDGKAEHRGLEGFWQGRFGAWGLAASAMILDAERKNSADTALNGKEPVNVPRQTVKLSGSHTWAAPLPVTLQLDLIHEGRRAVTDDNRVMLPSWTRTDLSLRAVQSLGGPYNITWRVAVHNLFDVRAWRESPKEFDHYYLFPMARRTVMASAQIDF
ncbi:MAG: TonB-dependent siderophore receptor [Aquabacterium sp.]